MATKGKETTKTTTISKKEYRYIAVVTGIILKPQVYL